MVCKLKLLCQVMRWLFPLFIWAKSCSVITLCTGFQYCGLRTDPLWLLPSLYHSKLLAQPFDFLLHVKAVHPQYTSWKIIWQQLQVASILDAHRKQQGEILAPRERPCRMGESLSSPHHLSTLPSSLLPFFISIFPSPLCLLLSTC